MKYYITNIAVACDEASLIDPASDILKTFLAEIGYEAFEDNSEVSMTESGNLLKDYRKEHPFAPFACFSAFIQQSLFDEDVLKATLNSMPFDGLHIYYNNKEAEDRNWNEQWEQSLEQSDICQELGITIDVKQAFGTGGHNTTRMIVNMLKSEDLRGKTVLDCGCGSGILFIAALKLGAERAVGYDIGATSRHEYHIFIAVRPSIPVNKSYLVWRYISRQGLFAPRHIVREHIKISIFANQLLGSIHGIPIIFRRTHS